MPSPHAVPTASTRSHGGVTLAEGRDPDGIVVMICYPGPDQRPLRELPARIYGW